MGKPATGSHINHHVPCAASHTHLAEQNHNMYIATVGGWFDGRDCGKRITWRQRTLTDECFRSELQSCYNNLFYNLVNVPWPNLSQVL